VPLPLGVAVARSTAQLSRDLRVRAVVVRATTGASASVVTASRPAAPVVIFSTDASLCRRLNLLWGVIPCQIEQAEFEQPPQAARRLAVDLRLATAGDVILLLAGFVKDEPMITVLPV